MDPLIKKLEALEEAARGNGRLDKLVELDSPEFREVLVYALSGDITFGMKQVPGPVLQPKRAGSPIIEAAWINWWTPCKSMLDKLAARTLTGSKAKETVGRFLGVCSPEERKWTERIIKQDLRLAMGAKDVNKVLPGTFDLFALPLAKPFKDLKSLKGAWSMQPKFDGGRVVARLSKKGGPVKLLSRSGKEWGPSFDPIKKSLETLSVKLYSPKELTLDGEVVIFKNGRMDFQAMQRMFFPKDGRPPDGDMQFVMFDFAENKEYDNPTLPYETRLRDLNLTIRPEIEDIDNLKVVDSQELIDPKKDYLDNAAIDFVAKLGCDGAIIRRLDKKPTNRKSSDITKVKPFEDGEGVIVGKVEGNGWLEGSLGTMKCKLLIGKKPSNVEFEIGTGEGLTKELRQELWDDTELVGKIVNFKYQRLTDDGIPLLPTYRGLRHPDDM